MPFMMIHNHSFLSLLLSVFLLSLVPSIVAWTTPQQQPKPIQVSSLSSKSSITKPLASQPKLGRMTNDDDDNMKESILQKTSVMSTTTSRRTFLPTIVTSTTTAAAIVFTWNTKNHMAMAAVLPDPDATTTTSVSHPIVSPNDNKLSISNDELLQIIRDDIVQRQCLVTGNITKSIYSPDATFTDKIDTYGRDQWMIGTQRLFVGDRSQVRLTHPVTFTSPTTLEFQFDEDLMFNLPIIKPIVSLTGKVILTRDPNTGYIVSYREYWDQDVATVLKSAKF